MSARGTIRMEKAREASSEQQPEKPIGRMMVEVDLGFFPQDFGLCMNLW